jgi:tRNA pseudouridine13 synthase
MSVMWDTRDSRTSTRSRANGYRCQQKRDRRASGSYPKGSAWWSTRATPTSSEPGICSANASASRSSRPISKRSPLAERLRACGVFNYYGGQRFGRRGEGLSQALTWLRSGAKLHGVPRFLTKLYPSVIQAEIFNRYFSARRELGLDRLLLGEVVRLNNAGAMFSVEDTERETPRLLSGDIHLTGPIFGPKARPTAADAAALELAQLEQLGLDAEAREKLARLAPGTRRDLIAPVNDLELRWSGVGRLELEFSLPSGSYATEVIRQFTHSPFLVDEADRGSDS